MNWRFNDMLDSIKLALWGFIRDIADDIIRNIIITQRVLYNILACFLSFHDMIHYPFIKQKDLGLIT